jgi:hypothetical protein
MGFALQANAPTVLAVMSYPDALRQFDYLERAEQLYEAFGDLPKRL